MNSKPAHEGNAAASKGDGEKAKLYAGRIDECERRRAQIEEEAATLRAERIAETKRLFQSFSPRQAKEVLELLDLDTE